MKPPIDDEDEVPNPTAASSNDPTIPLPTTTPHSFTPGQPEEEDDDVYNTPQSSQDTVPYQDVETEEPIISEADVEHLNTNGSDDTQPYLEVRGGYYVLVKLAMYIVRLSRTYPT